jgi:ZIP Zinc transporter
MQSQVAVPPLLETASTSCSVCCTLGCVRGAKAAFTVALTAEALVCIWIGAWIGRRRRTLHIANAVAAGVFLGSGLIHVLPHAAGLLEPIQETQSGLGAPQQAEYFPVAFALVLAMFYVMLLLDTVVLDKWVHASRGDEAPVPGSGDSKHLIGATNNSNADISRDTVHAVPSHAVVDENKDDTVGEDPDEEDCECENCDVETGSGVGDEDDNGAGAAMRAEDDDAASSSCGNPNSRFLSRSFVSSAVLVFGVSLHSLFEAISFGLAPGFSGTLSIFIAIAAHRWIFTSALLARLTVQGSLSRAQIAVLFGSFVVMMPVGAGIGTILSEVPGKVEGVFVSLAAGTFLYMGAFEGFGSEFVKHTRWKGQKFLAAFSGTATIVIIEYILVATGNTV